MIFNGVDISLGRRARLVRELTEGGHSAGYLRSIRAQLAQLDNMRLLYTASQSEQPSAPAPPATSATPDPWAGLGLTNGQITAITNSLTQMGYTKPADMATLAGKYMTGWQNYERNKAKYATWWKQIYGTDLPQFGFENNPFAVAAAVGSGNFMGYDLATLANQADALEGLSQGYTALGQAGSWQGGVDQLGFEQFRELAAMFGSVTPTQGEFAQLKAPSSTFKFQGADWSAWSTRYENWRRQRQTLYSPEEGKVSYQQGEEGFTAPGLKSRQQY